MSTISKVVKGEQVCYDSINNVVNNYLTLNIQFFICTYSTLSKSCSSVEKEKLKSTPNELVVRRLKYLLFKSFGFYDKHIAAIDDSTAFSKLFRH